MNDLGIDVDGGMGQSTNKTDEPPAGVGADESFRWPASRMGALTTGSLWAACAIVSGVVTFHVFAGMSFSPSPASGRLVDASIACIALPIPIACAISSWTALRWFGLFAWPGWIGFVADDQELVISLGPFGTRHYDVARITVRYPIDLVDDEDDGGGSFEAYLPKEQQFANFVPHLIHPDAAKPLRQVILQHAGAREAEIAKALRPTFLRWRHRTMNVSG